MWYSRLGIAIGTSIAVSVPGPRAHAQGRPAGSAPPARIGVTLATPPTPSSARPMDGVVRDRHDRRLYGWDAPILVERGTVTAVPVAVPVPYPVPYYARVARTEPRPPPVPYDPAKASMRIIGSGRDGGGGVMRLEAIGTDSLRVVWLGTPRPVREVRIFVADDAYQPMRTRLVDADRREARLPLRGLARPVHYAGVAVVYADGARMTTLVPTADLPR